MQTNQSYWIWYYGDYEIYHVQQLSLRRQGRGRAFPAFWHIDSPYVNVVFTHDFECDKAGYIIAHMCGDGSIYVDDHKYSAGERIPVLPGKHHLKATVFKTDGLPALYLESDICATGEGWLCDHYIGKPVKVGWNPCFDSADKSPEVFPFSYEHKLPVNIEARADGFLYDFGTELFGYLNIEKADAHETLGVFYGESREEALAGELATLFEYVNGNPSYRLRQRAFRYVFLQCTPEHCAGQAPDLSMDLEYIPYEQKGTFSCDRDIFNQIYEASVYTFHLNCREAFLDGIKRDRWVWSGDAYQSARIHGYLFADPDIVKRTALGLIGKEPIESHINTIVDYSLLWIIGLYEYYMTYGDEEFLRRIYPITLKLLAFCESKTNEHGFIVGEGPDWTFIDWSDIDKTGAVCAEQMLLIQTYKSLAAISKVLGEEKADLVQHYTQKSQALTEKVNRMYWNPQKGGFIDSYESGRNNITRHANIFAIMYDIATPEQTQSIVANVLKNDSITQITTPYFKGYELDVMGKIGEYQVIEDMLDSYWGQMLRLGANTIWEEYDPALTGTDHYHMYGEEFSKSLCHAWGAGAVYLFGKYYLGVSPTAPGYHSFEVRPNLGGLKQMQGTVPVNGGTVTVFLNDKELQVSADKAGGTLFWKGNSYEIIPGETLVLPA